MNRRLAALVCALAIAASASTIDAAILEVPANGSDASGIGSVSGWKCPPNDNITLSIDGGTPVPMATQIRRGDTAGICGNDGRNGFITQLNFGLLGSGNHSVAVRQNGQVFAVGTFHVTTFGTPFLSGASGKYTLQNFPSAGKSAVVEWSEGSQNFVITGATTGPITSPTPAPTPGPSGAVVRYGNDTTCNGNLYTSTMTANGFTWASFSGVLSPAQFVNRTKLGPITTSNSTCGSFLFPTPFDLPAGRRIAFVQGFESGNVVMTEYDEGPSTNATEAEAALSSELGTPIAVVVGVVQAAETEQSGD